MIMLLCRATGNRVSASFDPWIVLPAGDALRSLLSNSWKSCAGRIARSGTPRRFADFAPCVVPADPEVAQVCPQIAAAAPLRAALHAPPLRRHPREAIHR